MIADKCDQSWVMAIVTSRGQPKAARIFGAYGADSTAVSLTAKSDFGT